MEYEAIEEAELGCLYLLAVDLYYWMFSLETNYRISVSPKALNCLDHLRLAASLAQ